MQKDLQVLKQEASELPELAKKITSDDQELKAIAYLKDIMLKVKMIEQKRKLFTQDLVNQKRKIDNEFKDVSLPFKHIVTTVKSMLASYHQEKLIEAAKAAKNAKKGELVEAVETKVESVSYKKTWKFKVKDIKKVQKQYLVTSIDEDLVNEAIASGARKIPGFEIYEGVSVIGRV